MDASLHSAAGVFPLVGHREGKKGFENILYFMAVSSQDMSPCPSVGSELVNWLRNKNVSQKYLDKIAEHDLMQERGQALKGQREDRWYFTLLGAVQLFAIAGGCWGKDKAQEQ